MPAGIGKAFLRATKETGALYSVVGGSLAKGNVDRTGQAVKSFFGGQASVVAPGTLPATAGTVAPGISLGGKMMAAGIPAAGVGAITRHRTGAKGLAWKQQGNAMRRRWQS